MMSLNHSPSNGQLNLSKGSEEIECKLESTSPAGHCTSKQHLAERTSPTESALFKPGNCDFNECETVVELCTRQNQRPVPWTSSPIVRTNTALVLAEPTDMTSKKQLDGNRCKAVDLVSGDPDGIEDDPFFGTAQPTDAKMSLAAPKDVRPSSAMDRIKRLFNPHSKKNRDNMKEVGGNALAKGDERVPTGRAAAKDQERDQRKRGDHIVNKAGSVPLGMNAVLDVERNRMRTTEDLDNRGDNVRRERSRNNRIGAVDSATGGGGGHSKQNWRHGWMFKRQKKSGDARHPVVDVHSGHDAKKGTMLSACLMEASSTSPADEAMPNIALGQKIHEENVFTSEMVDNIVGSAPRISPTNAVRCLGKRREALPEAVQNQVTEPSCSRDRARNHSSDGVVVKSLARIQSIENVERWLMHGYQAPQRHTKSRQQLSRRSRRNYLYYMSSHNRSSISSSEFAISPTIDRHRCAWEHCQSEKGFDSNDSYKKDEHCCEPSCSDVNIKSKKVVSHEGTLFDARDGETMHLGVGRDACHHHHQHGDASMSKLNPSLLQFVAELIEGLEKAKHNESEWSTRFLEKTSIPVLPRVTNLADENLPSMSRKHCCSRSSTEHALNPAFHEADLLQNQNAEEPTNGTDGCHVKPNIAGPSDEVPIYHSTHSVGLNLNSVGLNLNSCDFEKPSEKLRKGDILNRPASLSGSTVLHRCTTVERKRTFSLDKLLDDFNSLNIDSRLPPQLNKLLPLGCASPSLLRRCLLQSMEGKSEIVSSRQVMPATTSGEDVFHQEKTDIVCQKPFAQLSADGFSFYADGQKIQYNILDQPDPTEVLEEVRLVAQDAKTLQQNTTEILEHVINLQWKKIRSLQSALSEEQAKRREAERKLGQLTSHPTDGGINNDVTAQLTSE